MGLFSRKKTKISEKTLYKELNQNKSGLGSKIKNLFSSKNVNDDFFEELEETLIMADVSVEATLDLMNQLKTQLDSNKNQSALDAFEKLVSNLLPENNFDLDEDNLNIIFVFGVNGVGKTTSIAKLCNLFKEQGLDLTVAAADTYRAAAVSQLDEWCKRVGVHLVKHEGKSKPSAVIFDAIDSALSRNKKILIVDTAGRLHNRENLMEELKKLDKILSTKAPNAKRYNLLVVDATTGQNAISQAKNFNENVGINGVFLSKMDSSAKGGIAITLAHELSIPAVFTGTGEKLENIQSFEKDLFIKSIFE